MRVPMSNEPGGQQIVTVSAATAHQVQRSGSTADHAALLSFLRGLSMLPVFACRLANRERFLGAHMIPTSKQGTIEAAAITRALRSEERGMRIECAASGR